MTRPSSLRALSEDTNPPQMMLEAEDEKSRGTPLRLHVFYFKARMTPLKMRGFVQVWSKKTKRTKLKEAVIETVEGEHETNLLVYFKSGELTGIFQLSNVVLRYCEERQSCLCLTLQNNTPLLINKLSSIDAEQLKMFLDICHRNRFQQPKKPESFILCFPETMDAQKATNKTLSYKPMYGSFNARKRSGSAFPRTMLLFTSNSSVFVRKWLIENLSEKRKTMSCGLETVFWKENSLSLHSELQTYSLSYVRSKRKKSFSLASLENNRKVKLEPSFKTNFNENCNLGKTVLPTQSPFGKRNFVFTLESKHSQDNPSWNKTQDPFDCDSEEPKEGFPNLGNTCYMNAILQSLFAIPSFADDLLKQGISWDKFPFETLIIPFSQLLALKDICKLETKAELLLSIKNAVSVVAEIFSGNMQNDAHEFLGQCLEQLKGDIENLNNLCSTEREPENGDLSPQMFAGDTVTKLFVCPIVANFEYELQVSIICKACGQVALKTEQNNYISINLHQEKNPFFPSIQNYFDLFFKEEEVKYNCEKCKNQNSILKNKFHQLPRVLIVHLKRYSLNDHWLLVKNGRQVEIPKYLSLSSHCNENTRPPCPLDSHVPVGDRKVSQEMVSENVSNSTQALKLTSEPNDPLDRRMGPDEVAELQTVQRIYEGASQEQEQTVLGSASKLEPELVKSRNQTLSEKKLPASKSMTDEGDISLPMICEDEGKPVSIPDPGFSGAHLQEVPEIPDLKNYKQTNILGELDYYSVTGLLKGLYGYCENKNPEGQGMAEQHQQHHEKRFKEEFLQLTPPPSVRKLDIQENMDKDLCRSSELRLQKDDLTSVGALGSDKNPENKYISESENIADEAKKPKTVKTGEPLRTYRLISIVSHIGSSHKSGHYISDVYDFGKQAWFTYNDLKVSEIPEAKIQEARLCSGYIFFYMHSEIFETLLEKAANSKLLNTQAGEIPQEAYEEKDFFHRLLDYLTPSIEGISEHCPE